MKIGNVSRSATAESPKQILLLPLIVAFAALLSIGYVSQETPTWFWDYANYHDQLRQLSGQLQHGDILPFLQEVVESIRSSDYNVTPVLPLLPITLLFSAERTVYILSLVLLYLLPACGLAWRLSRDALPGRIRPLTAHLTWLLIVCFPGFWGPTLRGYPDILGILPLAAAGHFILTSNYLSEASRRRVLTVGFLLWLSFLVRRHYAYCIVSILVTTLSFAAARRWRMGLPLPQVVFRTCETLMLLLAPGAFLMLILQPVLTLRILTTSYASLYIAYQADWISKLGDLLLGLGPVYLGLLILGLLIALREQNHRVIYCMIIASLTFYLLSNTQAPNMQHRTAIYLWFMPVICTPILQPASLEKFVPGCRSLALLLLFYPPICLLTSLSTTERRSILPTNAERLFSAGSFPPLQNERYTELQSLVWALEHDPRFAGKSIAVLPSSNTINDSIIAALSSNVASRLIRVGQVDQRDGFRLEALEADVIVASSDDSIHLPAEYQRVVTLPSRALFNQSSPLSMEYSIVKHPEYDIGNGNVLRIFLRTSPSPQGISELSTWMLTQFQRYYPDARIRENTIVLD